MANGNHNRYSSVPKKKVGRFNFLTKWVEKAPVYSYWAEPGRGGKVSLSRHSVSSYARSGGGMIFKKDNRSGEVFVYDYNKRRFMKQRVTNYRG